MYSEVPASNLVVPASSFGRLFAVVGSCCLFAPLVGLFITVASMMRSFHALAENGPPFDQDALSRSVGGAMVATGYGYAISLLGYGLVAIAILVFRFRPTWLRGTMIAASLLWLIAFPYGTFIGALIIYILIRQRQAFTVPHPRSATPV